MLISFTLLYYDSFISELFTVVLFLRLAELFLILNFFVFSFFVFSSLGMGSLGMGSSGVVSFSISDSRMFFFIAILRVLISPGSIYNFFDLGVRF